MTVGTPEGRVGGHRSGLPGLRQRDVARVEEEGFAPPPSPFERRALGIPRDTEVAEVPERTLCPRAGDLAPAAQEMRGFDIEQLRRAQRLIRSDDPALDTVGVP